MTRRPNTIPPLLLLTALAALLWLLPGPGWAEGDDRAADHGDPRAHRAPPVSRGGGSDTARRTTKRGERAAKKRATAKKRARRPVKVSRDRVAGGTHWRLAQRRRVLHVWRPPGYRWSRAGIVVFVHGYGVGADRVWRHHHLAEQFKRSRQNALFIVVDGPRNQQQPVRFPALGEVLRLVRKHTRLRLPPGRLVAMAHSSGLRTVAEWLDYRSLSHVILLDALFGRLDQFEAWFKRGRRRDPRRLTLVGKETMTNCTHLADRLTRAATCARIPQRFEKLTRRQRRAHVLVLRSQYSHSALVYNRKVIPLVLRRTRLRRVR